MNKYTKQIAAVAVMAMFAPWANAQVNLDGVGTVNGAASPGVPTPGPLTVQGDAQVDGTLDVDGNSLFNGTVTVAPDPVPPSTGAIAITSGLKPDIVDPNLLDTFTPVATTLDGSELTKNFTTNAGAVISPNGNVTLNSSGGNNQVVELAVVTTFDVDDNTGVPVPGSQQWAAGYYTNVAGEIVQVNDFATAVDDAANAAQAALPGGATPAEIAAARNAAASAEAATYTFTPLAGPAFTSSVSEAALLGQVTALEADNAAFNVPGAGGTQLRQINNVAGVGGDLTVEGSSNLTGTVSTDANGTQTLNGGDLEVENGIDARGQVLVTDGTVGTSGETGLVGGTIQANELVLETVNIDTNGDGVNDDTAGGNLTVGGTLAVDTITDTAGLGLIRREASDGTIHIGNGSLIFNNTTDTITTSGGTLTLGDANVSVTNALTVGSVTDGTATLTGGALTGATTVTASGAITGGSLTDGTATLTGGALTGATTVTASGAITGGSLTDGTATLTGGNLTGANNITASGTVTGGTLTDGTASLTGGNLTGANNITASGTVTGGTLTDGTASLTGGNLTGANNITASGTVTGGTVTDGTASLNSGNLTGANNITASGTVTGGTVTDGTASLNSGNLTGANNITASGTITGGTVTAGTVTDGTASLTGGNLTGANNITASGTVSGGTVTDGTASLTGGNLTGVNNITLAGDVFIGGNPGVQTQLNTNATAIGNNAAGIRNNRDDIEQNARGIAMVAALQHTTVLPGMSNALDVGAAHFEGETGMSINYARRINENWQINFGAASTTDFDESVIKAGVGVQW